MIRAFEELGSQVLNKVSEKEKKIEFLKSLTVEPRATTLDKKFNKETNFEIIFNFDLEKDEISIKLGNEVDPNKRNEYFGFRVPSANNSKLFFTSNNWNFHLLTIPHSLKYLGKNKLDSDLKDYYALLNQLNKGFYGQRKFLDSKGKERVENYIAIEKFDEEESLKVKSSLIQLALNSVSKDIKGDKKKKAEIILALKELIRDRSLNYQECLSKVIDYLEKLGSKGIEEKLLKNKEFYKKVIERYILIDILKKDSKVLDGCNINTITINGKRIQDTDYRDDYIDTVYFALKERFFEKKELVESVCGCCGVLGEKGKVRVTKKVDIPTKFYNTNQPSFAENLNDKNYHKSLGLCEECFESIRVGIGKIHEELKGRLFGTDYYLIPTSNFDDFNSLKSIRKKINKESKTSNDELKKLKDVERIEKKRFDTRFNILFWEKNQAEFIVVEELENLSTLKIDEIFEKLRKVSSHNFYDDDNYSLSELNINYLYYLLFPNRESHPNLDNKKLQKEYRKEALILFSEILLNRDVNYDKLISNFIGIYGKKQLKSSNKEKKSFYPWDAIRMNIVISWIDSVCNLKGGIKLLEGRSTIDLSNEEIAKFFNVHENTYRDNYFRQGLVLLGYLINQVWYKQKGKKITILERLNYDGIDPKRVKNLISDVVESLKIYKEFGYNISIYSETIDRLQGIESSKMKKDEVLFYILTGVGLGSYIGIKYGKIKNEENQNEGEEDNEE